VATTGRAIQVWDLRAVRRQLAAMGLDWEMPPYPPEADAGQGPLTLEVEGPVPGASSGSPREALQARLALYSLAAELAPYHPEPYHQRGHVFAQLGRPREAVADFTAALHWRPPGQPRLLLHLHAARAASLWRRKEYARARDDLRRAVALDGANLAACNDLAWLDVAGPESLRDPQEALPLAERAVAARPDDWRYLRTLGVVYHRLGEQEKAAVALERSLRQGGEAAGANGFFLAMCHWRLGDPAQARDCYGRAARWLQEQREKASPDWTVWGERLRTFQAEAEGVLAKPR
jgi:tetratricopeptide (TPR) repeat protein